ncbi:hypothetical protein EYF80_004058 [Liparis tanakae]|uniref:Uncharacterized protein n=1 Tax=Liparis tanakae TaxID=230148 RepID=A0A4Z2J790_9TELE|nr:hypothetical protein EYF80_004058 [Liparis tanakae]
MSVWPQLLQSCPPADSWPGLHLDSKILPHSRPTASSPLKDTGECSTAEPPSEPIHTIHTIHTILSHQKRCQMRFQTLWRLTEATFQKELCSSTINVTTLELQLKEVKRTSKAD